MNVKELIEILSKEVKKPDRETAQIDIWCGDQEFEIESMGGFSLSPDITIHLKKIKSPIMKPATFKKEHSEMVKKKMREIKKGK